MRLEGREGPIVRKIFYCDGCKWLGDYEGGNNCYHLEVIYSENSPKTVVGNLPNTLQTPYWCPFILTELRKEKLKIIKDRLEDDV